MAQGAAPEIHHAVAHAGGCGGPGLQRPSGEGGERGCWGWQLPAGVPGSAGRDRAVMPVAEGSGDGRGSGASAPAGPAVPLGAPCRWRPALPCTPPSQFQPVPAVSSWSQPSPAGLSWLCGGPRAGGG